MVKGVVAIPKVTMEWFGNMLFHSKTSSGHDIFFDSNESEGGKNSAPRPKEMLLYSLMACTGMDVVAILRKMKALEELESFRMEVEYEMTREHPRIFKKIILRYFFKFRGDPSRDKVEKAVNLSQNRYCGVSAMFKKFLEEFSYEIIFE